MREYIFFCFYGYTTISTRDVNLETTYTPCQALQYETAIQRNQYLKRSAPNETESAVAAHCARLAAEIRSGSIGGLRRNHGFLFLPRPQSSIRPKHSIHNLDYRKDAIQRCDPLQMNSRIGAPRSLSYVNQFEGD